MDKYERIEDAICKLESLICKELDIDLGDYELQPLGSPSGLGDNLRARLMDKQEVESLNDLDAWQNGSLVNTDGLNNLSLAKLKDLDKMLQGVK
tara:strand:- start:206 stop:487 length:282 start_codon:yes stop_codon:yes gene_type:complete